MLKSIVHGMNIAGTRAVDKSAMRNDILLDLNLRRGILCKVE